MRIKPGFGKGLLATFIIYMLIAGVLFGVYAVHNHKPLVLLFATVSIVFNGLTLGGLIGGDEE